MLLSRSNDLGYRLDELNELIALCRERADPDLCALTYSDEFLAVQRHENETGVRALRGLISAIAPLPGRKALIWLSNGFISQPGQVVMEAITRYIADSPRIESRLGDRDTSFESLLAEATRARVTFFSLKAGHDLSQGLRGADKATVVRNQAGFAGDAYRMADSQAGESLRDAARATGGRAIFTPLGADVANGLLRYLDGVYTLGIEVLEGDSPRSRLKVSLRDKKKKAKIQVQRRLPHRSRQLRDLAAVLRNISTKPGHASLEVALNLRNLAIERDSDTGFDRSRLALYSLVRMPQNQSVLEDQYRILEVPRGDAGPNLFTYQLTFQLPPGEYLVEIFVSDLVGGGQTTTSTRLVVPSHAEPG